MLNPKRVQALCFDIDGTLNDTDDLAVQRLARWLRPLRWLWRRPPEVVARRVVMALDTPFNELYALTDRLGWDDELVRLGAWLGRWLPRRTPTYRLIPGVREALTTLAQRYPLAVVSSRPEATTRAFLEAFGLTPLFRVIVGGQTCERTKPHPEPIRYAAAQMGVSPEACLMVGDTVVDILAGKAAGAQTVGVLCGFGDAEELQQAGADLLLPSPAALPEALHLTATAML